MKSFKIAPLLILLFNLLTVSSALAQTQTKKASVVIEGEVKNRIVLTPADLDNLPKTTIASKDRAGKEHSYSGAELGLLLKKAGAGLGDELKGKNLIKYLLVEASDGYQALFSMAEIDPAFTNRKIILASRKDGVLLSAGEGPFRIVIEGEKKLPRYVRQVISLKVKFDN